MNILKFEAFVGIALLMLSVTSVAAPLEHDLDVYMRVYKIPRVQNWESKTPDGNGDVVRIRVDGDLTAVFPDGIVLLQTDLSPMASDSAITQVIKGRVYFGGNNFKATRLRVEDLKKVQLRFDKSHLSEEVRFEKEISSHSREIYRLRTSIKSVEGDETIMNVSFDSGWSSFGGRLGTSISGTIFEQTIALPEYKIFLIGFPSHDKGPRGTVFWLAISVIKNEL
jgi:hypothetical protein